MRFNLMFLIFITACNSFLYGQTKEDIIQNMRVDVIYLASDYLQGRETGTEGELLAAQYITTRFEEIGLAPKGDKEGYEQTFEFSHSTNPHETGGEERIGKNLIGYIDNGAATTVIIGAHYDHIGRGAFGSRYLDGPVIHNGADDNASGVAALLYLADYLKKAEGQQSNYLFIAFSGEELGLYGSKHFVKNPSIDLSTVNYMLNMDMLGRLKENSLIINGAGTAPVWKSTFEQIKAPALSIQTHDSGIGASDHTSFYLADLPALHFFTGSHEQYHKPSDDSHLINYEGIYTVSQYMLALIEELEGLEKLTFTKTKDDGDRKATAFRVTLGVMPDYASKGEGMRIDAVLDNRAAQKAGIEAGDVIIKLGDKEVKDIYDYMDGLGAFQPGESTTVHVKRGKKTLKKKVTF